jgi:hypothetical protein
LLTRFWIDIPEKPRLAQWLPVEPVIAPAVIAWISTGYPPTAAARKKYHKRDTRAEPDRSLNCHIHFRFSFLDLPARIIPGMNHSRLELLPGVNNGYRVVLRDFRRFRKTIISPPAATHIPTCMSVSLIVFLLLRKSS